MLEYEPTAPEIAPHAHDVSRAATSRCSARLSAHAHVAHFMPNVIGSAWMPCVRPTQSRSRNSSARRLQISPSRRTSSMMMSCACVIWTQSAVSPRSELVMP